MPIISKYEKCTKEGCGRKHYAHGYCSNHYQTYRLHLKKAGGWISVKREFRKVCSVEGCEGKHLANGLCQKHYFEEIRRSNKEFLRVRYFKDGIRCGKCGKEFEWKKMDAHHPDPKRKEHMLSELVNNSALQRRPELLAELDECEMMCARCHQNGHHDPRMTHEETYSGSNKKKGRQIDRRKSMVREKFGEKCFECGDWLYPKEMEFHHRDRESKVTDVSTLMRIGSKEDILVEVAKCDIVCRNCHRAA